MGGVGDRGWCQCWGSESDEQINPPTSNSSAKTQLRPQRVFSGSYSGESGTHFIKVDMHYICTGQVFPERADIHFPRTEIEFDQGYKAVLSCDASQVTIILDSAAVDGWIAANILATQLAGLVVGALGLSLGSGYSVALVQVTEPDGTPHVFGVRPTGEAPGETLGFDPDMRVFARSLRLSKRDVFFRLAVRDYLRAITAVEDCATHCYRAIESIKSAFVFETGDDRWDDMHTALGTDRTEIASTIKDYADPVRHGNWVNAKMTDKYGRWRMLQLTRNILEKYLKHAESAM